MSTWRSTGRRSPSRRSPDRPSILRSRQPKLFFSLWSPSVRERMLSPRSGAFAILPSMKNAVLVLVAGVCLAAPVLGEAERVTLALSGGQIIDGYGGPPIPDGAVLIAGDRIVAV